MDDAPEALVPLKPGWREAAGREPPRGKRREFKDEPGLRDQQDVGNAAEAMDDGPEAQVSAEPWMAGADGREAAPIKKIRY